MKFIVIIFQILLTTNSFSQTSVIKILENDLTNPARYAHSEMKNLGLILDGISDKENWIVFVYLPKESTNSVLSGSFVLGNDFNTIWAFSLVSSSKELTEIAMKELKENQYIFSKIREGETIYSNGKYELGFKTENSSVGTEYRVSISRF